MDENVEIATDAQLTQVEVDQDAIIGEVYKLLEKHLGVKAHFMLIVPGMTNARILTGINEPHAGNILEAVASSTRTHVPPPQNYS